MLHSLFRSLGRSSHTAKRASRRKLSPSARRRPESAIEWLEERMLLSAAPYDEYSSVQLHNTAPFKKDALGNEVIFSGSEIAESDSIVAAYIYWQGVDLVSDGGDGVYDDSYITVNGTVITGECLGVSDSFGRGEGGTASFRADVSDLLQNGRDSRLPDLYVSGMATKPGHSRDHAQLIVLTHSESLPGSTVWLRTTGIQSPQDVEGPFGNFTWYNPVQPVAANLNFTVTYVDGVYQGTVLQGEGTPQRLDQFELVQRPSVGFVTWGDSFDFYAPAGFEGHVSFTYRVRRGLLWSEPATVDVTVVQQSTVPPAPTTPPAPSTPPENHRPFAGSWLSVFHPSDDQLSFSERLRAFDDDGDALRFEVVSPPAVGTIRFDDGFVGSEGCVFTYIRPSGFIGEVFFTYRVFDGLEYSEAAPATISIRPLPAPKLEKQTVKGTQGQPVVAKIQWQDPNLNPVIVSLKTAPKVGTLVFDSKTLEFVYTPPKGFTGTVSFDCILFTRNAADIALETVTIVIEPAVEPVGHKPQHGKPQHGKPQHDKPQHDKPHHDKPQLEKPHHEKPTV
jgi:hypothetical protein